MKLRSRSFSESRSTLYIKKHELFIYFTFRDCDHHHPVLYMRGVKPEDMAALLDFMYHGQVSFPLQFKDSLQHHTMVGA